MADNFLGRSAGDRGPLPCSSPRAARRPGGELIDLRNFSPLTFSTREDLPECFTGFVADVMIGRAGIVLTLMQPDEILI